MPDDQLRKLEAGGLLRQLRPLDSPAGARIVRDGRELWNFASNDYLGFAHHPSLAEAFHEGIELWGSGAGSSRLITGSLRPHHQFEENLAEAKGCEAALMHSSGFATAIGTIPAIVGKGDHVLLDKLCHACLIDGAKLSGATLRVFPHNDTAKLGRLLASIRAKSSGRILILTESVFSMDGDLCPLREIVKLKQQHGALLFLDEAHGFGLLGQNGMGLAEELGLQSEVDFQMGTLSKAAGLGGAYLACSNTWRELLVNRSRSFVYSTAPPPALAHAATTALRMLRGTEGEAARKALHARVRELRPSGPATPIIPLILGSNEAALAAAGRLEKEGFLVPAIRYPTVPPDTARLRISLTSSLPLEIVQSLSPALPQKAGDSD